MKITTQYENHEPFEGNRSLQYLGIALFMEADFFHITRDTKFGKPRPDPRINLFNRKLQKYLRQRIMDAAKSFGISMEESEGEWLKIVYQGTGKATKYVQGKTDAGRSKEQPLTVGSHRKIVEDSFKVALRAVSGTVHEREMIRETWTIQPGLDFGSDDSVWIYIRHDHPSSDLYKIGKTMRKDKRSSAYETHSAESREIATYPESDHLTEKKIHAYFASKRFKREFFRLTPEDVATVTDPKKMRAALVKESLM